MNKLYQSKILRNEALTEDIYLISLRMPEKIESKPGQFCILRINSRFDPLLGRPFSIFDYEDNELRFLYRIKGKGTKILSKLKEGDDVSVIGPLGRWYPFPDGDFTVVVGGIGLASVYYLIKRFPGRSYLFYGVRTKKEILFYEELKKITKKFYISTENGVSGYRGVVTDLFKEKGLSLKLPVYCCGPMIMLGEFKKTINTEQTPCYVAVEQRMACGLGACLGCVIPTKQGLKRVCIDGPIFKIDELGL